MSTRVAKILIEVFELKMHDEEHDKWYIVNNVLLYLFNAVYIVVLAAAVVCTAEDLPITKS